MTGVRQAKDKHGYVLVVDDEEANIELLKRALRSDVTLWVARDGTEARAVLAENRVDLVVTDQRMPGETGAQLLAFVAEKYPNIARFLLTEFGDSQEVDKACRSGIIQRLMLKPFSPLRFKGAVLEQLRLGGAARQPCVLVADDDRSIRRMLTDVLASRAIATKEASDGVAAIACLAGGNIDTAIVDLNMPRVGGDKILAHVQTTDPDLPVLILTAQDYTTGFKYLEAGAFDYLVKPFRKDELIMRVERALLTRQQAVEHRRLLDELQTIKADPEVVAHSESMKKVVDQCRLVAGHDVTVLVTGETGTGKEVVARMIHAAGRRASGPFMAINCGALPETLIESEFFGHQKGAFTDAIETKPGVFEAGDGGSVFLDEVGELSLQSQVRLLRVIETREVTRLGATQPIPVDVRVIAATHRDLGKMVADGRFRQDLFYRLDAFRLAIPPLRERKDDVPPLIELAVARFCSRNQTLAPPIDRKVVEEALRHDWPGNVRELFHVVERALITRTSGALETLGLSSAGVTAQIAEPRPSVDVDRPLAQALNPIFEALEKEYLTELLKRFDGQLGRCAEHAGIHRKSLYNKLKRFGLAAKDAPPQPQGPESPHDPT